MKSRPLFAALALAALVALLPGCSGSSSGSKVAAVAPPGSPIFVEGTLRPTGDLQANTEAVVKQVAGIDNLSEFVVEELESSAQDAGEPLDYAEEVEPWLGERAGVFFQRLEGDEPEEGGVIVESADPDATREFLDSQVKASDDPYRSTSYEGVDYEIRSSDEEALGVVGDFLVLAEDERSFKDVVDASQGDALADEDTFADAISAASNASIADVYVDVGALIDQGGGEISPQGRRILGNAGIDPSEATAVASIIPGADQIEVELSSDLGGEEAPTGDASELLGSLPSDSFAAFAVSGFGKQLQEAIDSLDREGIGDTVPPNQLKKGLKEMGIDLDSLAGSLQDAAAFAVGNGEASLGGALVLSTKGTQATNTVSNLGLLLRSANVGGVTALSGKASGFSVRDPDLGDKPLVVATEEGRIAIGYGLPATLAGLASRTGRTLADDPAYGDAVDSLGGTPISGFADGRAALRLADSLIPSSDDGFTEAKRYLKHIEYLALGSATQDELATAKLIIGLK